jgi:hypothetical protein
VTYKLVTPSAAVKVPLHTSRGYTEVEAQLHSFLTQTLDRSEWSASSAGLFSGKEIPVQWKGLTAGLDVSIVNNFSPITGFKPGS